jgi:hypothetical protein
MTNDSLKCLLTGFATLIVLGGAADSPAYAQYRPVSARRSATTGQPSENYHVELSANVWGPGPGFVFSSDGVDTPGTPIDAKTNLGIEKKAVYDFRLVIKVAAKHKFRFGYHSMAYTSTRFDGPSTFNGREYPAGAQIDSRLEWTTYRLGYEYDLVSTASGFFGVVLQAKVTRGQLQLSGADVGTELATAKAPIPAIGAIARVYLSPKLSVTAEYEYFQLPSDLVEGTDARYSEIDVYSTYNVSKNIAAQLGYRKATIGVTVTDVHANAKLGGLYAGAVVRF